MPTVTIGDNTGDDFAGTEDNSMIEWTPTTNNGTANIFDVASRSGSFKNAISSLSFSGISNLPSSLTVTASSLNLYLDIIDGADTIDVSLKKLLRGWVETEETWTIWKTSNNWTTAGGQSDGNDRSSTVTATSSINSTIGYKSWSNSQLSSDIEDFADGTLSNYGWSLYRSDAIETGNTRKRFASSENAFTTRRPYLSVTYSTVIIITETITEGFLLSDSITDLSVSAETITEGLKLSDSIFDVSVFIESLTEGLLYSDSVSDIFVIIENLTEGVVLSDLTTDTIVFTENIVEGVLLSDIVNNLMVFGEIIVDGVKLSDSVFTGELIEGPVKFTISVKQPGIIIQTKQSKITLTIKKPGFTTEI